MLDPVKNQETKKNRRILKRLLFAFAALLLIAAALVAAELVLRAKDIKVHTGNEIRKNRLFFAKIADGPLQMDEYITLGAKVYPLAPGNYRIDKKPEPKKDNETLILCLGDSCTWGVEVETDETYCSLVARNLTSKFPERKFRSINAGRPGYTSYQGNLLYETIGPYLKPDVVLFHFGPNDGSDAPIRADKQWGETPLWALQLHRRLYLNVRLYQIFRNINMEFLRWRVRHPTGEGLDTSYHPRVTAEDFAANMQSMRQAAQDAGALFVVIPSIGWNFGKVFKNPYFLHYALQKSDVDAFTLFEKAQKSENVFLDSVHNNVLGHKLLAEALTGTIADSLFEKAANEKEDLPTGD